MKKFERPFWIPKDLLDTINSVTWFLADGFWMLGLVDLGLLLMVPTFISGLILLYIEKRRSVALIGLAINFWIWMNALWMCSDKFKDPIFLKLAQISFGLGILSILIASFTSRDLRETFSHFRRFRHKS